MIYLVISIIMILCVVSPVEASSSDLVLNDLEFKAQINQDGSMDVTEKWDIKIRDTNTLYKTFKIDKTRFSNITNVEVTEITNGSNQVFREKKQWSYHMPKGSYFGGIHEDKEFEIAWGVGLEDSSATRVYNISYHVEDAVAKYSDYAELYWQFVGEEFEVDAQNITGTILLPSHADNKSDIKVWGHTEGLNGEIYATNTNKIEFNMEQFHAGRYIEIRTLFPTELIINSSRGRDTERLEEVIEEETTWADQANAKRKMSKTIEMIITIVLTILSILSIILIIKSIIKNIRKIKTSKKLQPSQKMEYFREMPREDSTPAEALMILLKQVDGINNSTSMGRVFSATLLDLSLKKIIDFEVKDKMITIKILRENPQELEEAKDEKVIYEFLKKATERSDGKITIKELEKYIKNSPSKVLDLGRKIDKNAKESLYQKELADSKGKKEKNRLTVYIMMLIIIVPFFMINVIILIASSSLIESIGILLFTIILIIQLIVFCILSSRTNVLTQKGIDENEKWKGLKKYMEDFSMLDKREVPEIAIWEKFLVYATAFGIADKVLKQLKIVYPNMNEEWNHNYYGYMYLMMNTDFSSSFSNAISSSMSMTYSSATGGGGGFSAGGRRPDGGRRSVEAEDKFVFTIIKQKIGELKV